MKIKILFFLLISHVSFAKARFVRVIFNSNASYEATIIWDQNRGDFIGLTIDTTENLYSSKSLLQLSSENFAKGMHTCIVRLKNLKPNQKYFFSIKDSEGYSRLFNFSTVPDSPNYYLSLIAGGDSRGDFNGKNPIRTKANKMVSKLKAHAVLFNGDFINLDLSNQWIAWFEDWEHTIDSNGRITPLIVSRGNHERSNRILIKLFDVPHPKLYYSTEFGGNLVNVISLNSEILKIGRQKFFLKNNLEKHNEFYWQIPQYHRPIRAHVSFKKEMNTQYKNFVPLFEKFSNVRLCLENDSHTCKVTWPIISSNDEKSEEGFIRNDSLGIVYAGEGCWGAPLRDADDKKSWTRDAGKVNQFNWIFISKKKIELRTVLYENVDEVEENSEDNRFQIPVNLKLFGPLNGELVEILQSKQRNLD